MNLRDILEKYSRSGNLRFHMPGHGGRSVAASPLAGIYPFDVTELPFTDDLHAPDGDGAFAEIESYLKEISGARDVILSCAGSTSMIQTAVCAAARRSNIRGKNPLVIAERAAHMSVIYSLIHNNCGVAWIKSGDFETELETNITGNEACVIVTSPDYYGNMRDIEKIAGISRRAGVPLICDSAHGAHLEFYDGGALSAFRRGSNLAAMSLHKTLPAMTGAAVLLSDGTFTKDELLFARRRYSSSSPSYIISLSIAECADYMKTHPRALDELHQNVTEARASLEKIGFDASPNSALSDPFRLYIKPAASSLTPELLSKRLADSGIICEFHDADGVVLIPSVLHTRADYTRLYETCAAIVSDTSADETAISNSECATMPDYLPQVAMSMTEAASLPFTATDIDSADGKICAEPVYLYPPGIPLVMPGEIFCRGYQDYLKKIGITDVYTVDI